MFVLSGKVRLALIVLTVNFSSLMCGIFISWPSPVIPKLKVSDNPVGRILTDDEISWIGALSNLGGIIGPTITGFICEKFGRKLAIASVHIPNIIATLAAAFGKEVWIFYAVRFIAGMSISSSMALTAIYFGEVAESHYRGLLYSTSSIFINLGTLLSYIIGAYTSIMAFNLILFGISLAGIIFTMLIVPESPYFLLQYNKVQKAHESLEILRNSGSVEAEINTIRETVSKVHNDGVFSIFKTQGARKAFFISLVVTSLNQYSGIGVIYTYTQTIFESAGSSFTPEVSSILVGVAQFLTIYLTPLGVERFGRRIMLIISSSGLLVTLTVLATYFMYQDKPDGDVSNFKWLPLLCLMLFFLFFNCGMGGLPFLVMSELLPHNVKSAGTSIIMAIYWTHGFLLTYFYSALTNVIYVSGCFYLFASCAGFYALFIYFFLIETQGKTLQEILDHSNKSKVNNISNNNLSKANN